MKTYKKCDCYLFFMRPLTFYPFIQALVRIPIWKHIHKGVKKI